MSCIYKTTLKCGFIIQTESKFLICPTVALQSWGYSFVNTLHIDEIHEVMYNTAENMQLRLNFLLIQYVLYRKCIQTVHHRVLGSDENKM